MREIKFRAWDKIKKSMVYPTIIWNYSDESSNKMFPVFLGLEYDNINDISNLMQYTGLKDKNGKEIYEGDIVAEEETVMSDMGEDKKDYIEKRIDTQFKYAGGKIGERRYGRKIIQVKWQVRSCGFEPFSDSEYNCGHCCGGRDASKMEVIGNIYQNPELLDNKEMI